MPKYLQNRPKDVVHHIMKRINTDIENISISQCTSKLFSVRSRGQLYQVWLGSDTRLPTCQCIDYRTKKLPCKHICAVVQQPGIGWESLGSRFDTHPLMSLDQEVTQSSHSRDSQLCDDSPDHTSSVTNDILNIGSVEGCSSDKNKPFRESLPCRKKSNIRMQCIQELKSLQDELYILTDKDVLNETLKKIREALNYARQHRPKENGITLKDKSLSPKKIKIKRLGGTCNLAKRKKKNYYKKRVGSAADAWNAKVIVVEDEANKKRKRYKSNIVQMMKRKKSEDCDMDGHRLTDVWMIISGIKLSYELRDILLAGFAWLTDDHIDAAQHLIKELNPRVGGLNYIAATTHRSRFAPAHDANHAIQCHNIGLHWVTSSSISGKVVVYESLYRTANESLKRQLVYTYKELCNDDGSLDITVVLQQRQKGTSDCGLFCIANAVALANGIDPSTVSWDQNKMRDHLYKCFEQRKIEMFPHEIKQTSRTKSHYVVSIYCICFRHIPGAQMVHCSVCDNWFHHARPQTCMKLSAKQVAALATETPFICNYCENNGI